MVNHMVRYTLGFAVLALVLASGANTVAAQDFTVSVPPAMTSYTINGQTNPTLTLVRGHTYTFAVSSSGHPFYIKTAQVTGTGSQFTTGVTNNGTTSGTLTFDVPTSAPNQLFYQCSIHSVMTGVINITSPSVPSGGAWSSAFLAFMLLAAGAWRFAWRRRENDGARHWPSE